MVVTTRTLRRQLGWYAEQAGAGETIVVLHHGHPWAVLRPLIPGEDAPEEPVSAFRASLRRGLTRARRGPRRLTWHHRTLAVIAPIPPDLVIEEELA